MDCFVCFFLDTGLPRITFREIPFSAFNATKSMKKIFFTLLVCCLLGSVVSAQGELFVPASGSIFTSGTTTLTFSNAKLTNNGTFTDNNGTVRLIGNAANAAANAAKIDLVYLYRNLSTSTFTHALVAPAADTTYLPGITLPAGVNRNAKLLKVFNLQDYNLSRLQYGGIFIDDIDFEKLDMTGQPNFAINLKAEAGVWVETADGKYRAYVYINSVNANGSAVISMKRYTMK